MAGAILKSYRQDLSQTEIPTEKLLKQLLARATEFDLEHWISINKKGEVLFAEEKEYDIYDKIQQYEKLTFWHELPYRLAERDLEETLNEDDLMAMSIEEELDMEMNIQKKYEQEFRENGLQNLRLVKSSDN